MVRVVVNEHAWRMNQTEVLSQDPPKVPTLEGKSHWLQCIIRNATDFPLRVVDTYFDTGVFDQAATDVLPYTLSTFTCHSTALLGGATGGAAFKIELDENNSFYFSIGYTNPTVGTYMAGLTASSKAIDGYNAASDKPGSLETVMDYGTTDTDGLKVRIKLRILATPNEHRPQFEITEIRDYKGA